jgi:hypothetical protein
VPRTMPNGDLSPLNSAPVLALMLIAAVHLASLHSGASVGPPARVVPIAWLQAASYIRNDSYY